MHVISRPAIVEAIERHSDAASWLRQWWRVAAKARWRSLEEVRATYPGADQVERCLVFNVRGNKYRLIVGVKYADQAQRGTLWVKRFLTHAEYGKGFWRGDC